MADRMAELDAWVERGDQQGVLEWIITHAETLDEAQAAADRVLSRWDDE